MGHWSSEEQLKYPKIPFYPESIIGIKEARGVPAASSATALAAQRVTHGLGASSARSHWDGGAGLPSPKAFLMCILLLFLLSLRGRALCQLSGFSSCSPRRASLSSRLPGRPFRYARNWKEIWGEVKALHTHREDLWVSPPRGCARTAGNRTGSSMQTRG